MPKPKNRGSFNMITSPSPPTSALSSPQTLHADSTAPSYPSTLHSSLSLHSSNREDQYGEEDIGVSSHNSIRFYGQVEDLEPRVSPQTHDPCRFSPILAVPKATNVSKLASPELGEHVKDDTEVRLQPLRNVNYLSYDWKEEDVWSSWKHIISKRNMYSNSARLENGLWGTWTKSKNKLKTVSPEQINWLRDCDVTWLYGPLHTGTDISVRTPFSTPASSTLVVEHNSFLNQKPILKKRSMSETMLQRSLSATSLVKQAAAEVQVQQLHVSRRGYDWSSRGPATSECVTFPSFSIFASPRAAEEKHLQFDEQVKQCIALEMKGDEDEGLDSYNNLDDNDSNLDDRAGIMRRTHSKRGLPFALSRQSIPAGACCAKSITIAMLPSATLKNREDSLPLETMVRHNSVKLYTSRSLPSIFTIYEEDEDDVVLEGPFGKMVDTVNRAKDIAYMIWNVGWR